MTLVTPPSGPDFDVTDYEALAYYRREPGYVVHDGVSGPASTAPTLPLWAASTSYKAGQEIWISAGTVAVAQSTHLSGSTYAADKTAGKWVEVAGGGTSTSLSEKGAWAATTAYVVGDIVTNSNQRYIAVVAHTSGASFVVDLAASKWTALDAGPIATLTDRGAWATTVTYFRGDVVTNGSGRYTCATTHTAGTFSADLGANYWTQVNNEPDWASYAPRYTVKHRYDPATNFYNFSRTSTAKFRNAVGRMRAGGTKARIAVYGDSNIAGYGVGSYVGSPGYRTRSLLMQRFPNMYAEGLSWMVGSGGSSYYDLRWTLGAEWGKGGSTGDGPLGQLGWSVGNSVTPGILSWAPGFSADTFKVYYRIQNSVPGGTFDVWLDAGGHTSFTTAGTPALGVATVTGTLGTHTLNIQPTQTGKWYEIYGAEAYDSTANKILMSFMGVFGSKAFDWNAAESANYSSFPSGILPDLSIILLGHNDLGGTGGNARTAAQFTSDITTFATNARNAGGDVMLIAYPPSYRSPYDWISSGYAAAYYSLADSLDCPLIDLQTRWGEAHTVANAAPYQTIIANDAHLTDKGAYDMAAALGQAICLITP